MRIGVLLIFTGIAVFFSYAAFMTARLVVFGAVTPPLIRIGVVLLVLGVAVSLGGAVWDRIRARPGPDDHDYRHAEP